MKGSRLKVAVVDYLFDDLSIEERGFKKVNYELVAPQCKTEDAMIALAEEACLPIKEQCLICSKLTSQKNQAKQQRKIEQGDR